MNRACTIEKLKTRTFTTTTYNSKRCSNIPSDIDEYHFLGEKVNHLRRPSFWEERQDGWGKRIEGASGGGLFA